MQLMKQNGIQVNNNNSNSAERLSAQQYSPKRAAAQARGLFVRGQVSDAIIIMMFLNTTLMSVQ